MGPTGFQPELMMPMKDCSLRFGAQREAVGV